MNKEFDDACKLDDVSNGGMNNVGCFRAYFTQSCQWVKTHRFGL
jgi:hypothetical protein